MLLSDFNKVMPLLKENHGFWVKWLDKDEYSDWYSYQSFASRFDFTKIQVIKCRNKPAYSYGADFDFELTLKKI